MKRFNMHYEQRNPEEYFQPYAVENENGQWCRWQEVVELQHKLAIAIEALHIIAGSGGISRITAEEALKEIEEVDE
jgi:hypothetical protein